MVVSNVWTIMEGTISATNSFKNIFVRNTKSILQYANVDKRSKKTPVILVEKWWMEVSELMEPQQIIPL